MGFIRQLAKSALTSLLPRSVFLTQSDAPGIALTFDDGPHPEYTPRVLDVLAEAGVHATFFVVGQQVRQHPSLVQRMVNEGHDVGNHTWSHSEPSRTSTTQFLDEVRLTDAVVQEITQRECSLMRPPKGELTLGKLWGLVSMKKTIAMWNRDPKDYRMASGDEMSAWCAAYEPQRGDIVLLHDNRPYAAAAAELLSRKTDVSNLTLYSQKNEALTEDATGANKLKAARLAGDL